MIDRHNGQYSATCDQRGCNEYIDTEEREFSEAIAHARDAGWKVYKEGDEWVNCCPDCAEKEQ